MTVPALSDIVRTSSGTSAFAAGGSPGGSTNQVQYNNGGSFAGATDVEIEGGQLRLDVPVSEPVAPAAGGTKTFASNIGGRVMPAFKGPSGRSAEVQPHVGCTSIAFVQSIMGTTVLTQVGIAIANTGAASAASWASTNLHTKMSRIDYLVTTATATAVAGWRYNTSRWTVGNNNSTDGGGGFHFICRWGPATGVTTATNRAFVGMTNITAAPTDVEPSTITNIIGMGWDAADTNVQIMHRGAGAITKIDLGSDFPVPTTDRTKVYELVLFSPPNTTTQTVGYRVEDLTTGSVAEGTLTTNLPTTTTALAPRGWMSVGGTSSVIGISLMKLYIESDL